MIEVLRNKNLTTKFQILVEIADRGPDIQQREIAAKLEITPQAVSDYIARLVRDNMLVAQGRSSYKVTNEGVNWVIKALRELSGYSLFIQRALNNISVCAAIAGDDLEKNQAVSIKMKDGLLLALADGDGGATGVATSSARAGEDVGISNIKGIVPLDVGMVTIVKVPSVERGGSRKVNYKLVEKQVAASSPVTSLGLESGVVLRRLGAEFYQYGAAGVAIESARSGLNPLVVCAENETPELITRLEKEKIRYQLIDAEKR
ncbi:MAG: winged helix-turn-helix transcriptional regulator [Dehalococcoidia bacterium]|jgi:putative transcriptional regulator